MKKILLLNKLIISILILIFTISLTAQPLKIINYQAWVADNNNSPLNKGINITFAIYEDENGGSPLWLEVQPVIAVNGYINAYLGRINPITLPFDKQYWLSIMVDDNNPFPRVPLTSVPYSIYSQRANSAETANIALSVLDGSITQEKLDPSVKTLPGGIASGDLSGLYPNPIVSGINNKAIDTATPLKGQALIYNGAKWLASSPKGALKGSFDSLMLQQNSVGIQEINAYYDGGIKPLDSTAYGAFLYISKDTGKPVKLVWSKPGVNGLSLVWNKAINEFVWGVPEINTAHPIVGDGTEGYPISLNKSQSFVSSNQVLYFNGNAWMAGKITNNMLSDGLISLDKLKKGTRNGQILFWSQTKDTSLWKLSLDSAPVNGQILRWSDSTLSPIWANDGISFPYEYSGTSKDTVMFSLTKQDKGILLNLEQFGAGNAIKATSNDSLNSTLKTINNRGGMAFSAESNISEGNLYVAEIKNSGNGRALYIEGSSRDTVGITDYADLDNAVLVIKNLDSSSQKTALKTYGNIKAIGAITSASASFTRLGVTDTLGISVEKATEKLDVGGGIKIGNSENLAAGTIRWNGKDFEGSDGKNWKSLTSGEGGGLWKLNNNVIYSSESYGIARSGSNLLGNQAYTHINLGYFSTTGEDTQGWDFCTISGGLDNSAKRGASTVGGGIGNEANDIASTISGGLTNIAEGFGSTIGGGYSNTASGDMSVIPGGSYLKVGARSFGYRGGIGANPSTELDVSSEPETFHIVEVNFHFNYNNANRNFIVDGTGDNLIYAKASNNRVGIGTNNPSAKLQVGTSGDGSTAVANAWQIFSDIRLKKDFQIIDNPLEKISKIAGYYYFWKEGADTSRQVGVIAQEIEKVLPELVRTDDNGIKSVDYSRLTPLLIEAVKRQQEIIANQQKEINSNSSELEKVKEQYKELKEMIEEMRNGK